MSGIQEYTVYLTYWQKEVENVVDDMLHICKNCAVFLFHTKISGNTLILSNVI